MALPSTHDHVMDQSVLYANPDSPVDPQSACTWYSRMEEIDDLPSADASMPMETRSISVVQEYLPRKWDLPDIEIKSESANPSHWESSAYAQMSLENLIPLGIDLEELLRRTGESTEV